MEKRVSILKYVDKLQSKQRMRRASSQQPSYPFKLDRNDILLIRQLENWYQNQQQTSSIRILSHPMSQKQTMTALYFFISRLSTDKKQLSICILSDTKTRSTFLLQYASCIVNKYFHDTNIHNLPLLSSSYVVNHDGWGQIVFSTFKSFVQFDLKNQSIYHGLIIETSNFVRVIRDGFADYITDTYLRRGYIEALKLLEGYKQNEKQNKNINLLLNNKKPSTELQLISLHSRESSLEKMQQKQIKQETTRSIVYQQRKLKYTFELKREQLLSKKGKMEQKPLFEQNELVLISTIIYIIGFLNNQIQIKKTRDFKEFLEDFQNKTSLNISFLQNIMKYLTQIYQNCPIKIYDRLQDMYLYSLCNFMYKIVSYRKMFPDDYQDLFQVIRPEKQGSEKKQQSTSWLAISCKQNNKICLKAIQLKSLNTVIIQNLACPEKYWHYIFKKNNMLMSPSERCNKFSKLYGLHISKTPSNQDLNFAQKLRADVQTIKIKACGVLLHDLSKFIPDGIVAYFYSFEGLQSFIKELQRDDERILKRIQNNKKVFFQSIFEEQNNVSYDKFKKCCQIGRGAIFMLSANGKAAQHLTFSQHLSRCIIFFGLPRRQNELRREQDLKQEPENEQIEQKLLQIHHHINMQKISIINECLNNCLDRQNDYKSIIFVGAEISNDLSTWYQSFIKSWDETTRDSLMRLRSYYQRMGVDPSKKWIEEGMRSCN